MRVQQNHPENDGDRDDAHVASVGAREPLGQVSGVTKVGGEAPSDDPMNGAPPGGTRATVSTAEASALPMPGAVQGLVPPAPESAIHARALGDDTIVSRAAAGDGAAFRALFTRHRGDVARLVYRMLGGPSDLDDVVQEVFVQVYKSLKDFRGQSKFSTWLHRVTVNVVLMHRRSAKSRPVLTEEAPHDLVADDAQVLPDEDAERRERMRAFQRLLARLADKKRIVFVLHELEGLAPSEIAEIVGAPVLTVRTRLFYARRELEEMLSEEPALAALTASFSRMGGER